MISPCKQISDPLCPVCLSPLPPGIENEFLPTFLFALANGPGNLASFFLIEVKQAYLYHHCSRLSYNFFYSLSASSTQHSELQVNGYAYRCRVSQVIGRKRLLAYSMLLAAASGFLFAFLQVGGWVEQVESGRERERENKQTSKGRGRCH